MFTEALIDVRRFTTVKCKTFGIQEIKKRKSNGNIVQILKLIK